MSASAQDGQSASGEPATASIAPDGGGRRIEQDGSVIELDAGVGEERPEWAGETDEAADRRPGHSDPDRLPDSD